MVKLTDFLYPKGKLKSHSCCVKVQFVMEMMIVTLRFGNRGSTVVKVLCYKSEGRCVDPSWCQCIFSLT